MAKAKGRRKFRKYLKGQIDHQFTLGTLAAQDVVSDPVGDTVREKAWLTSVKATWSLSNITSIIDSGPILVGIAHSDYTDAEIEEWIENLASWDSGDMIGQEVAKRKIRRVGLFGTPVGGPPDKLALNDGKPIRTKCGWQLVTGQTVKIWAYNTGTAALATTVPVVHTQGFANLWPN